MKSSETGQDVKCRLEEELESASGISWAVSSLRARSVNTESNSSQNSSYFFFVPCSSRASHFLGYGLVIMIMALESDRPDPSIPGCLNWMCLLTSLSFGSLMHKIGINLLYRVVMRVE